MVILLSSEPTSGYCVFRAVAKQSLKGATSKSN